MHVGYAEGWAFRSFIPDQERVFFSKDVTFFEKLNRENPSKNGNESDERISRIEEDWNGHYTENQSTDNVLENDLSSDNQEPANIMETDIFHEKLGLTKEFHGCNEAETMNTKNAQYETKYGQPIRKASWIFYQAFITAQNIEENTI